MKKLMFMLVAVGMAVAASAAQVSWEATKIKDGWDGKTSGFSNVDGTTYLFLDSGASALDTVQALLAGIEGGTSTMADVTALALGGPGTISGGTAEGVTADGLTGLSDTSKFYALIVDDSGAHAYLTGSQVADTWNGELGASSVDFGSQITATKDASNWYAATASGGGGGGSTIPEPTSGLLMLVGLGALALRRKR